MTVSIKDRSSGLWLQTDGSWGTTVVKYPATLGSAGAPSTTWSISFALPDGVYAAQWRTFTGIPVAT